MCNGELSLHVLDIIQSIMQACRSGKVKFIKTKCKKPKIFKIFDIKQILN